MARFLSDDEDAALKAFSQRQAQRAAYAAQATPAQAQQISALSGAFPFMSPRTVVPLAQSGVTPDSPVAKAAAHAEVKRRSRGFGWHSIGDTVSGAVAKAHSAAKGVVRGAMMGLEALPQAIQGEFRNNLDDDGRISFGEVVGVLNPGNLAFSQTDAGVGVSQIAESVREGHPFQGLNYGSGFFAGKAIKAEQTVRAREASAHSMIDGHAATLGRWSAQAITEPGTKPYRVLSGIVDGTLALAADPSTWFGGAVTKAAKADKLFAATGPGRIARGMEKVGLRDLEHEAAGLVTGLRDTVIPERVTEWIRSAKGQAVVQHFTDTNDFTVLRKQFPTVPTDTLVQLADSRTPEEVLDLLSPKLGVERGLREKPSVPGQATVNAFGGKTVDLPGATARRKLENVRMFGQMPGEQIDLTDIDHSVDQIDRFLLNARFAPEERAKWVEQMARAGSSIERYAVLKSVLDDTQGILQSRLGVKAPVAKKMTKIFENYHKDFAKYFVDEIGDDVPINSMVLNGEANSLPAAHLFVEYVNRAVPLPNARDLRTATSGFANILSLPGVETSTAVLDFATQQLFKPMVLLRGAWTVRVVGEEQVRMAASGMTSAFRHPMSHIAMATGRKMNTGLTGDVLADTEEGLAALSKGSNGARGPRGQIRTRDKVLVSRGEQGYSESWADEMSQLHADPVANRVAAGGLRAGDDMPNARPGIDGVKDWFFDGPGQKFRKDMAQADGREHLLTREGADAYVDSVTRRVAIKSNSNPDLMNVIATGKHNGKRVFEPRTVRRNSTPVTRHRGTRAFLDDLDARASAGEAPDVVKGDRFLTERQSPGSKVAEKLDLGTEAMFNMLMSRPSNWLSRSPAFKQFYWQRSEELMSFMSSEAQAAAIQAAKDADVDAKVIRRMEIARYKGNGKLSLAEADTVAKGHGLDETRKLLYDLHEKSQFFDITRNIFPFGEAWKEVLGVWAKIGTTNPTVVHRAQLGIAGARKADTDGDGKGFFFPDPQTGQEMFAIPGIGNLTEQMFGTPDAYRASVQGANIFSQSVMPGFGPIVQIAVGKVLPDDPSFDEIRKYVIPYGENDTSGGIFESFLPAWYKKFQTSGAGWVPLNHRSEKQQRAYIQAVGDITNYLVSTGKYRMDSEGEQQRTLDAANKRAKWLFILRGMAQYIAPSPPSPQFAARDKDGNTHLSFQLAAEYRKLQEADYRTATEKFVAKFGEGALMAAQPGSQGGGPVTKTAYDFVRENPDLEKKYGDVAGLFAPGGGQGGEFNNQAYQRQLSMGTRKVRTPEELIQLTNQRLGTMVMAQAKASVGEKPTPAEKQWLRTISDRVEQEYPGFNATPANMREQKLALQKTLRAIDDPVIAQTDAGKGLAIYVTARQKAIEAAQERGFKTFASSPDTQDLRDWLEGIAGGITDEHPDFAPLYDQVLSRENSPSGGK